MPLALDDRYTLEEGRVYLTGVQALVRLPLDQHRRDRRGGLRTGTFISGYPGSPLGGYDLALQRIRPLLEHHQVVQQPGANEELAATAITGTQMLDSYPTRASTASSACGTAKAPESIVPATPSSTATSPAPRGTARSSPSWARTTRARARPCPSRTTTP